MSSEIEQMKYLVYLLNMMFLTLDDEYNENEITENQLQSICDGTGIDYNTLAGIVDSTSKSREKPGKSKKLLRPEEVQDGEVNTDNVKEALVDSMDDVDREIMELQKENSAMVSRIQRETFLTKKYDVVLNRHQELLRTLQENIRAKGQFDSDYSVVYGKLFEERSASFDDNIDILQRKLRSSKTEYAAVVNKIRHDLQKFVGDL